MLAVCAQKIPDLARNPRPGGRGKPKHLVLWAASPARAKFPGVQGRSPDFRRVPPPLPNPLDQWVVRQIPISRTGVEELRLQSRSRSQWRGRGGI